MTQHQLDHLVVNTRFETEAAQVLFAGLGFTLTPRGHHSLGSINHLAVFENTYLELIGLPLGSDRLRQEILDSPVGINGLVFASVDAEASYVALRAAGFELQPVQHFTRPVHLDGRHSNAHFSTVSVLPGQLAAGRVYVCQHHTPELVWRPDWTSHANGVSGIAGLVIVGPTPQRQYRNYARLGLLSPDFSLDFMDHEGFSEHYGALASHAPKRTDFFGAIRLRCGDLPDISARATALALPLQRTDRSVLVALPTLHTLLEFCA
jgi:hypothetical protein